MRAGSSFSSIQLLYDLAFPRYCSLWLGHTRHSDKLYEARRTPSFFEAFFPMNSDTRLIAFDPGIPGSDSELTLFGPWQLGSSKA